MVRSIQILRGVAATLVVCRHLFNLPLGVAGVDIFFVISGFIIATIAPSEQAGRFLARRCARIYPLYWLCLIPATYGAVSTAGVDWSRLLASIALVPVGRSTLPYLDVGWSLMFELLFYAAVAATLYARSAVPVLAAFIAFYVANAVVPGPVIGFFGHPMILEFLAGVAIVRLPRHPVVGLVALGAAAVLYGLHANSEVGFAWSYTERANQVSRVVLFGIPAAMTVYAFVSLEKFFGSPLWAPLVALGDASYALYLTHSAVTGLEAPKPLLLLMAIFIAIIIHRYIERPIMAVFRGKFRKHGNSRTQPTPLATA